MKTCGHMYSSDEDTKIEALIKEGWINESEKTCDVSNNCKWDYTVTEGNKYGKYMLVGVLALKLLDCYSYRI